MQILIRPMTKLLYWMLILTAVVIGVLRLGFAHIDYFKSDIEGLLRQSVLPGLSFSDIELDWKQFDHQIHVRNATLALPNQIESVVVEQLSFEVSLWRSLLAQSLVVNKVNVVVESLHFRKGQGQQWWLSDIPLNELVSGWNINSQPSGGNVGFDVTQMLDLTPRIIHLNIKQITIDDESTSQQHKIENTVFDMQYRQGVVRALLNTNLLNLGGEQSFQGIYRKGKGLVYSKLKHLNLQLARLIGINLEGLQQAEIGGDLWLHLDKNAALKMQADLSVNNGEYLVNAESQATAFSFDTRLNLTKVGRNWGVIGQINELVLNTEKLAGFELQLNLTENAEAQNLSGWVKQIDLSVVTSLASRALPADVTEKIKLSQLKGELNNIWFNLNLADTKSLSLSANLDNISSQPVSGFPGFSQLSGSLVYGGQNLQLISTGEQLSLDLANQFRAPLEIERYTLHANTSFDKTGVYVSVPKFEISNSDISLAGRLTLDFDQADTAVMYLRANLDRGNGSSKSKYLPIQLLPESALAWLDDGIKGGEVSEGNLLYHGRLQHLRKLEREKSGEFYVDFKVNKAQIMFAPEWDEVREAQGIISFHNLGMIADISSAQFGQIEGARGQVSIADLSTLEIDLNLQATTEATKALPTWLAMPISRNFRKVASNFKNAGGQVQADLKLVLPLEALSQTKVHVDLTFDNASVQAPVWEIELQKIYGKLEITKDKIFGQGIKAHYFDDPITVRVDTDQNKNKTNIEANGQITTRQLMRLLPDYMSTKVSGKSDWKIQLAIDNEQSDVREPVVAINGQTDLKNTQIALPAPLFKPTEFSRETKVTLSIYSNDSLDFGIRYGSHLLARGDLEAAKNGSDYQLKSMDIGLSTSLRPYELHRGIRLYGSLPTVSVDDWLAWYQTEIGQRDTSVTAATGDSAWNFIEFVEVQVLSAIVQRRHWSNVNFLLTQETEDFLAEIKSSHLTGRLTIPKQQSVQHPIVANLEHVKYETLDSPGPASKLLPGDFYNLKVTSKSASYDDYHVENLRLETGISENQLAINRMDFQTNKVMLQANGKWEYEPVNKTHVTNVGFVIKGTQFGESMAGLGLGDAIRGGKIKLDSQLTWPNSLLNFDWDKLTGNANLLLEEGILKDVEPGSGRLIGLLSLNALPRRLLGGFSDVVAKGLEFDKISGTYTITGENLYTSDTQMDGPSAKVLVTGTTGLRSKRYDQKMYITPKVRQTLPVIGGIAAGSAVGWGLLLFQRLFKNAIDKTVEIEYTIKGSWEDPEIVLIEKPKSEQGIIKRDK